jgi:hypothetical protein
MDSIKRRKGELYVTKIIIKDNGILFDQPSLILKKSGFGVYLNKV